MSQKKNHGDEEGRGGKADTEEKYEGECEMCEGKRTGIETGREREMEGMIMSGNVCLSIRIWTPINNMHSQSTA